MKKSSFFISIFLSFLLTFSCFFFTACKKVNPLYERVSELRLALYEGQSENFTLSASYGFKETPYNNDSSVGKKVYLLTFKLLGKETDGVNFSLSFNFNSQPYSANFKLNPVTHNLTASVEIDDFNEKKFSVTISGGGAPETVNLKSILPENTLDYKKALDHLYADQQPLINAYLDKNGNFNAEIYARVLVKNQKPYWYIGIASGNGNLKALLIDGFSGKTLAIREIF